MEFIGNKHYIRLNENNQIIKGFSDAFEQPLETDICINENGGRHFELNGIINPSLVGELNEPLFKYDGEVKETTDIEKAEYIALNSPQLPDPNLTPEERIDRLELIVLQTEGVI